MSEPEKPFGVPGSEGDAPPPDVDEVAVAKAANRFDIRRLIGGLFILYGVVLTIAGIVGSSTVKHKAAGINIDLWSGIGMLIFGALMVFWALTRPTVPVPAKGTEPVGGAPAT